MELNVSPKVEACIDAQVQSGRYADRAAVVEAAVTAMEHPDAERSFAPGELDALMAEGKRGGPPVDGLAALAAFRQWREAEADRR